MKYKDPGKKTKEEVRRILDRDDPEELLHTVVSVGLYEEDYEFAYKVIHELASHPHRNVKANAILCFGHLARRFQKLPQEEVKPIIESALESKEEYIYGQAWSAADDVKHFLGWKITGFGED